jgi:glycosyltransferase involved in cell wall biosynthesis
LLHQTFNEKNYTSNVITLDYGTKEADEKNVFRIPSLVTFSYRNNRIAFPLYVSSFMQKKIDDLKPAIIHVHHPFLLGKAALHVARKNGIPIIFTYHTQYEHYLHYVPVVPKKVSEKLLFKRLKDFCAAVDGVIAPSETIKQQLEEKFTIKALEVIPSPVEDIFFIRRKKVVSEPFRLITVSRFAPEKNVVFLLDVMKQLPENKFHLTLIGYGSQEQYLRAYAYEQLKLSPACITFIIKPLRNELASQYAQADLFIFASATETQGLVLLEAMASALPIVALNAAGSKDIVDHHQNGFLISSKQEMCSAILALNENRILYEHMSNAAATKAVSFNKEDLSDKLASFYQAYR